MERKSFREFKKDYNKEEKCECDCGKDICEGCGKAHKKNKEEGLEEGLEISRLKRLNLVSDLEFSEFLRAMRKLEAGKDNTREERILIANLFNKLVGLIISDVTLLQKVGKRGRDMEMGESIKREDRYMQKRDALKETFKDLVEYQHDGMKAKVLEWSRDTMISPPLSNGTKNKLKTALSKIDSMKDWYKFFDKEFINIVGPDPKMSEKE